MKNTRFLLILFITCNLSYSCRNDADKLTGRWHLTKRISPQGNVVDDSSPFNFMENYVSDFNEDGKTLLIEYDSKGLGKRHGTTHREKHGEYSLEKGHESNYPYTLTLRVNDDGKIEETANKVRTLSSTELIYISLDNFTWYFEKQ